MQETQKIKQFEKPEGQTSKDLQKMKRPIRTLSGVAPMSIMVPPRKCPHGTCTYCPTLDAPQSYTPTSPAVIRAKAVEYDPGKQVLKRLAQFEKMGHSIGKVELIIMGGTFIGFEEEFQFAFIKGCYDALNGFVSPTLEEAKKANETAKHRCVALCIETRPDHCSEHQLSNMLKFGCTRVEIGVQALDDEIYKKINRGHTVQDVIDATRRLKKYGFKVGYHLMWGLPGATIEKDIKTFDTIFESEKYRPDQLKIYPCQVIEGAAIATAYRKGKFIPYTKEQIKEILYDVYPKIPPYCRVMRIMREFPAEYLVKGSVGGSMRTEVETELKKLAGKIQEIRYREIGIVLRENPQTSREVHLDTIEYNSCGGKELFMQMVNKDNVLFGLLRLRLELGEKQARVREIHVYGQAALIGENDEDKSQHKGMGKQLMEEAERVAFERGYSELSIISGVGVREYYRKLGYELDGDGYMVKRLRS